MENPTRQQVRGGAGPIFKARSLQLQVEESGLSPKSPVFTALTISIILLSYFLNTLQRKKVPIYQNPTSVFPNITPTLVKVTPTISNITPTMAKVTPAFANITPTQLNITPAWQCYPLDGCGKDQLSPTLRPLGWSCAPLEGYAHFGLRALYQRLRPVAPGSTHRRLRPLGPESP